jgi:CheY-like chemotaxis protein
LKQIKDNDKWKNIPVVVLTAKDLNKEEKEAFKSFGCSVWLKPALDRQALVEHVDTIIKGNGA